MPCLDVVREMGYFLDVAMHNAMSLCTKHRREPTQLMLVHFSSILVLSFGNSSFKHSDARIGKWHTTSS
jgi:hypothetical protein